jgi:hypothetical protein
MYNWSWWRIKGVFGTASRVVFDIRRVGLAYQPPASSTFLSEQTNHQQPASILFSQNKPAPAISHQPNEQADSCAKGWNKILPKLPRKGGVEKHPPALWCALCYRCPRVGACGCSAVVEQRHQALQGSHGEEVPTALPRGGRAELPVDSAGCEGDAMRLCEWCEWIRWKEIKEYEEKGNENKIWTKKERENNIKNGGVLCTFYPLINLMRRKCFAKLFF